VKASEKLAQVYPYQAKVVHVPSGYESDYPWKWGDNVLILAEITNMPGHVAVVTLDGKTHWGYHPDDFEALEE
jgi:hypothetical protein